MYRRRETWLNFMGKKRQTLCERKGRGGIFIDILSVLRLDEFD